MPPLLVATGNPHKLREIEQALGPFGVRVLGLADVQTTDGRNAADLPEPDEHADTFEGNAALKALAYAKATGRVCLADDSGLEVDALNGAPGVLSARYSGEGDTRAQRDVANNAKLLLELDGLPGEQRSARFVCAVCVASPDGKVLATARGEFEGRIGTAPRGENGFGYDPLLVLEDGRTSAELTPEEKNARSHRGAALRAIAPQLTAVLKD